MANLPDCLKDSKCIIHIDLDCFFCQVEEVRLGLDSSKPVAVQQWSSLIAVNYEARRYGVNRLMTIDEARGLCPELTLVHVPTYAPNETKARYHSAPSRITHKSSMDTYYNEGKKIFNIFQQHCALMERVNSDEAFLDVTSVVNERLCTTRPVLGDSDWNATPSHENGNSWFDIQLELTAELSAAIRKQVFDELHYTCSAGIAHNKTLAKLGSSMHKPNKQTVIRHHMAADYIKDVRLTKIWNLGGKFGQQVKQEYNIQKAGDLWKYPLEELQQKFGEASGLWLYNVVRGIDDTEVKVIKGTKSLMSTKSICPPISSEENLGPWYTILSAELFTRITTNWNEQQSWTLSISYRNSKENKTRMKSTAMKYQSENETIEKLAQKVKALFATVMDDLFPCTSLGVHATRSASTKNEINNSNNNHTIKSFFTSKAPIASSANTQSTSSSMIPMTNVRPETTPPIPTPLTWICDRCNASVPLDKVDEHTDYHFAMDLANDAPQHDNANSSGGEKRKDRQDEPTNGTGKRHKHLFF